MSGVIDVSAAVGAIAGAAVAVLTLLALVRRMVVTPITSRMDRVFDAVSIVEARRDGWDDAANAVTQASTALAAATAAVAANTDRLDRLASDVQDIRAQVHIDGGDSLKDQVLASFRRGDERHAKLDNRLDGIERHLKRQDTAATRRHAEAEAGRHVHADDGRPGGSVT